MNKRILVLIPAFNEEKQIAATVSQSRIRFAQGDLLVVNDGSSDDTSRLAKDAGAKVLDLPFHLGYGVALQTGYKYARERGYDYLLQMDADGQHDPKSIIDLYQEISKDTHDLVIGSRFIVPTYKPHIIRRIGMRFFAMIAYLAIRQRFTDPTSGFRAMNRKAIQLYCKDIWPADFPDVDVIIMSRKAGLTIKEIPVIMHPAQGKKSMHSGLKPFYYIFKMLLSIMVTTLRHETIENKEESV
jgi:glycosyltransferase involved in cell wall biosynthesis